MLKKDIAIFKKEVVNLKNVLVTTGGEEENDQMSLNEIGTDFVKSIQMIIRDIVALKKELSNEKVTRLQDKVMLKKLEIENSQLRANIRSYNDDSNRQVEKIKKDLKLEKL